MEVSMESLDGYIIERLSKDDYLGIERYLMSADDSTIVAAYLSIFPELFRRYVELTEAFDDNDNENLLTTALEYISDKADTRDRYMSILEVYQDVQSTKSLLFLCKQLEAILSMDRERDLERYLLDDLRDDVLPYFLHKLQVLVKEADEAQYGGIIDICDLYIDIFRNCYCKNFFLLDDLVTKVLSLLPFVKAEIFTVLKKYVSLYEQHAEVQPKPVLLAVSLHKWDSEGLFGWLIPFLVYSSTYNLYRCTPIFYDTLEKSGNNPNCLFNVAISLKAIITSLDDGCLIRDLLPLYTDFIGKFLAVSVYPVMADNLRAECLRICKDMIYKFEPVAQVLIIKRIIKLIVEDRYENILEPQAIAWLLDCYRSQLGKYECFCNELGFLWADLAAINYENMHDAVNFYAALMVLAQYQALLKVNKPLIKVVKEQIIDPLESKIAEWSHLMKMNETKDSQTVPYLQIMMVETCKFISAFLNDSTVL